jgi:arylformamidase
VNLYDATLPIQEGMVTFPGDPPAHYLDGGATVDEIPLESLVGPGVVLDMRGRSQIDQQALEKAPLGDHVRVLFKTDNGPRLFEPSFHQDFVHLTEDGARYLVQKNIRLVGNDYLSIERYKNPGAPVHHILLEAGVLVVEGVNLLDVPAGPYEIFCLPIKIKGADGAPARILLRG